MLFFSGNLGPSGVPSQFPSEIWRFDGTDWALLSPTPDPVNGVPDGRQWYAAAFDRARGVYVLFGGQKGSGLSNLLGDTWEYDPDPDGDPMTDDDAWSKKSPTNTPSPRRWAAMSYHGDETSGACILFGGETANSSTYNGETWSWDGTDWTNLTGSVTGPSARGRGKMAYDPDRGETMYSAGRNAVVLGETWIWTGTDWANLTSTITGSSPSLFAHGLTYDEARDRYVLFGGTAGAGELDNTWEFDRSTNTWTNRGTSTNNGRSGPGLAYVRSLGSNFLFGGFQGGTGGLRQIDQTWKYQTDAIATFTEVGIGCATSLGVPSLTAKSLPWLGEDFDLTVDNVPATATSVMMLGTGTTSISLGSLGIGDPSCIATVDPSAPFLLLKATSTTTGVTDLTLPVPSDAALVGASLLSQAVLVDFGTGLLYVSNRGDAVFGAL
jgi:hypothetical protein